MAEDELDPALKRDLGAARMHIDTAREMLADLGAARRQDAKDRESIADFAEEITTGVHEIKALVAAKQPQASAPELDAQGPGGLRLRLVGVTGGQIIWALVLLVLLGALIAIVGGWLR